MERGGLRVKGSEVGLRLCKKGFRRISSSFFLIYIIGHIQYSGHLHVSASVKMRIKIFLIARNQSKAIFICLES